MWRNRFNSPDYDIIYGSRRVQIKNIGCTKRAALQTTSEQDQSHFSNRQKLLYTVFTLHGIIELETDYEQSKSGTPCSL